MLNVLKWFTKEKHRCIKIRSDKRSVPPRRENIDFDYLINLKPEKRILGGRRRTDCEKPHY